MELLTYGDDMNDSNKRLSFAFRRIALAAAIGHALLGSGQLLCLVFLIGFGALTDPRRLVDLAIRNPVPLYLQDGLKALSVLTSVTLVCLYHRRLAGAAPRRMRLATLFGCLAAAALLSNAALSMSATAQAASLTAAAGRQAGAATGLLGVLAIMANGVWFLLAHGAARNAAWPSKPLAYLGVAIGCASLIPPLAIAVLVFSIVWALGVAVALLQDARSQLGGRRVPGYGATVALVATVATGALLLHDAHSATAVASHRVEDFRAGVVDAGLPDACSAIIPVGPSAMDDCNRPRKAPAELAAQFAARVGVELLR